MICDQYEKELNIGSVGSGLVNTNNPEGRFINNEIFGHINTTISVHA